jgi:hypothetical protein
MKQDLSEKAFNQTSLTAKGIANRARQLSTPEAR